MTITPAGDKYMYPFINDSPNNGGKRMDYGAAFGAYGALDDLRFNFDDRDAQFFLDFTTQQLAPAGRGASKYRVASLTLTIVVENPNSSFVYDPTFDPLSTFVTPATDSDAGRPLELYGVGYRPGWTRGTFTEDSPFQSVPSSSTLDPKGDWNRKRNVFAMDFSPSGVPRDVSNNVEERFETNPWALADSQGFINQSGNYVASPIAPGSAISEGRVLRFHLVPTNPSIIAYLQDSFHAGRLHLMVSSLYGTVQYSAAIPRFYSKEIGFPELVPKLTAQVLVMPDTTIEKVAGGFRINFDTVTGQNYQVQYRESFASGSWLPLGSLRQGTGGVLSQTDATSAQQRFYRVAVSKTQ